MFQNINNKEEDNVYEVNEKKIELKNLFTINDIVLYVITFMMSMVSFNGELFPFGLAMFAASCSNRIPSAIVYITAGIRNINS